ncbi:MFS transporter [Oceanobacillus picturae]|uniref:MFS transporter n=1 Tax=Oceanobacillus picturae TaxID=171693 RepID=UPI0009EA35C7|nr:MFS transporter [Oceanobacillus picturae]
MRWVVPEKQRPQANGHLQIAMMTGKLLSYSLGAILIKVGISLDGLLLLVVISFILSIFLVLFIKPFVANNNDRSVGTLKMAADGLSFIKRTKVIRNLFVVFGLAWIIGSSIDIFLITYLNKVLGRGTEDLYLITTFSLAGIIIGSFVAPKLYDSIDKKIGFYLPSLIFGMVILGYALRLPLWLLLPLLMIGGFVQGIFLTFLNSYLQEVTSQIYYARVASFYTLLMKGASLPGYFLIGFLIEKTNVITVGYFIGIYMFFVTAVSIIVLPRMKGIHNVQVSEMNH